MSFRFSNLGNDPLALHRVLEDSDPCSNVGQLSDFDQQLHVASIFILFLASALGVAVPLAPKYSTKLAAHPYLIVLGKCAGIGVMISCGLVHMILPSTESLTSDCLPTFFNTSYPAFSFVFALLAVLCSHLTEFLLVSYVSGSSHVRDSHPIQSTPGEEESDEELPSRKKMLDDEENFEGTSTKQAGSEEADAAELPVRDLAAEGLKLHKAQQFTETLLTEFSLSVHSIFIGIALGVSDSSTLVALLIALVFHQILEGVALGCRLADGALGSRIVLLFGGVFAVSGPFGVVVGIGVYRTLNPNGAAFLLVQGVFDGLCGGLLLYAGFQLLMRDFRDDVERHCLGTRRVAMIVGMFAAMWLSALAMSVIGAWA